jgi:hypothetical protein
LTKKFFVPVSIVEGSAENSKLFGTDDCVLHNFIIEQNSNGHDALIPAGVTELKSEDLSTVANCRSVYNSISCCVIKT